MASDVSIPWGRRGARDVSKVVAIPQFLARTALAFITVSSVASLRPAPTMAVYGQYARAAS